MRLEYYVKRRWLCNHLSKTANIAKSLQDKLQAERCLFEGKVLPIALMPLMLSQHEFESLKYTSEILSRIIEKTIDAIFASPRVREYLHYEGIPKDWLDIQTGYKRNVVIGRLDALFDGKNLKYIEFKMDNPGAIAWTDIAQRIFVTCPFYQSLVTFAEEDSEPIIEEKLLDATLSIYKEFRPNATGKPNVVFVDYKNSPSLQDATLTAEFFTKNGIPSFVADPRDIKIDNGLAHINGKRIDLVQRALKAESFMEHPQALGPFIKAYSDRLFCMVNSFRSVYGSENSFFALLSNPDFYHLFEEEEIKVIKKHIPWTRMLSELETHLPSGKKVALGEFVKAHRKHLVLKPSGGYGGKNVILGVNLEQAEWEKVVTDHLGNKDWIVQEYVPVPTITLPVPSQKKITLEKRFFNLSPFVVNGSFSGVLCRFSDSPIVNIKTGGGILPVVQY